MSIYFVYKFRIKKSGLFYIGVTQDLDRRKLHHYLGIAKGIINYGLCDLESVYGKCAQELIGRFKTYGGKDYGISDFVKKNCIFKVIDIKDTRLDASVLEDYLIKKHKSNSKFINKEKFSNYATRKRLYEVK